MLRKQRKPLLQNQVLAVGDSSLVILHLAQGFDNRVTALQFDIAELVGRNTVRAQ